MTAIIGELCDRLDTVTTDENGENMDEHTHVFAHKGHTLTVTHKHLIIPMKTGVIDIRYSIQIIANQAVCAQHLAFLLHKLEFVEKIEFGCSRNQDNANRFHLYQFSYLQYLILDYSD
jgi:hypothetical protein